MSFWVSVLQHTSLSFLSRKNERNKGLGLSCRTFKPDKIKSNIYPFISPTRTKKSMPECKFVSYNKICWSFHSIGKNTNQ